MVLSSVTRTLSVSLDFNFTFFSFLIYYLSILRLPSAFFTFFEQVISTNEQIYFRGSYLEKNSWDISWWKNREKFQFSRLIYFHVLHFFITFHNLTSGFLLWGISVSTIKVWLLLTEPSNQVFTMAIRVVVETCLRAHDYQFFKLITRHHRRMQFAWKIMKNDLLEQSIVVH